eukprot:gene24536-biopygen5940
MHTMWGCGCVDIRRGCRPSLCPPIFGTSSLSSGRRINRCAPCLHLCVPVDCSNGVCGVCTVLWNGLGHDTTRRLGGHRTSRRCDWRKSRLGTGELPQWVGMQVARCESGMTTGREPSGCSRLRPQEKKWRKSRRKPSTTGTTPAIISNSEHTNSKTFHQGRRCCPAHGEIAHRSCIPPFNARSSQRWLQLPDAASGHGSFWRHRRRRSGKLDYSLMPSISFAGPERACAAVWIAARRPEFPGTLAPTRDKKPSVAPQFPSPENALPLLGGLGCSLACRQRRGGRWAETHVRLEGGSLRLLRFARNPVVIRVCSILPPPPVTYGRRGSLPRVR